MKMLSLSPLVFAVGLVGGCSATGNGTTGPGLRGMLDESGGNSSISTGGAALGGTGSGGKTGGSTGFSTGGKPNGLGASGGTPFGSGGKGSGGASFGSGGVTGSGGMLATGGSNNTGGVNNAQGGSLGSGGTTTGGATTGGASAGGTGGGASTGGTGGGASTGGTGGGAWGGLIGYWKFDEVSGTTAADSSGIAVPNDLVASGCATLGTASRTNGGKRLKVGTGSPVLNDCSGLASKASVDFGTLNQVTVAFWMKNESGLSSYGYVAALVNFDSIFSVYWEGSELFWSAGDAEISQSAPTGSAWHHVAATWNATSGDIVLYFDGSDVGTGATGNTVGSGAHVLSVGKNTAGTDGFAGGIDDVRIYNRVLSDPEIAALAQ